jgi:hypothetical protein
MLNLRKGYFALLLLIMSNIQEGQLHVKRIAFLVYFKHLDRALFANGDVCDTSMTLFSLPLKIGITD